MNYPIWELSWLGGGTLIAIIAVTHVYVSHLAIGGGLFLWLTDWKGVKENNPDVTNYVRKHTWFFLLMTMVFGGMSGVGIWFVIALVHPGATSKLIHNFVFGWAIEWVFFLGEIVALLIYHYYFDKLKVKDRLRIAFLYFLFAWLSLVIINGILSFMLTPGKWLETGAFWDGFLNPSYLPSTIFRTFASIMFAGIFGYVTAVFFKDSAFRTKMMRYCTKWMLYPAIGLVLSGLWYYNALPTMIQHTAFILNPDTAIFVNLLWVSTLLIFVFGILLSMRANIFFQRVLTFVLVAVGLVWMGGFEYTREIARKPYIISDYMYTTGIMKAHQEQLNENGLLKSAKWVTTSVVTDNSKMEAGENLFRIQCLRCHTNDGIWRSIQKTTKQFPYLGMYAMIEGIGKVHEYMPQFVGTDEEQRALATYIAGELNGVKHLDFPEPIEVQPRNVEIPPFDKKKDEYVLLAWNDLGMHCISDCDAWFSILPPANTLEAILIKRGAKPEIVTENIEITYTVPDGHETPSNHVKFWDYAEQLFGVKLEKGIGLGGNGVSGKMEYNEETHSFIAEMIPIVPFNDDGSFNPFPTFTIEAYDTKTKQMYASIEVDPSVMPSQFDKPDGKLVATTKVVAPTSTMGCGNCHGHEGRVDGKFGISDETAINILKAHDRINGTNLYADALNGKPKLCQSCHEDPVLKAKGKEGVLSLPAAMHGWHANFIPQQDAEACGFCHPSSPSSATQCSRGVHNSAGITCVDCHGTLGEHALALLKAESHKESAARLMKNLKPVKVASVDDINPRIPWLNEPKCVNCHKGFEKPADNATGYNVWTAGAHELYRLKTDKSGIRCEACHGSPHAIYPTNNIYGENTDNIQPMQYNGTPFSIGSNKSCNTCHTNKVKGDYHHANMYRQVRFLARK